MIEKSGVLNLGVEGMMLVGAAFGFSAVSAGNPMPVAILAGALAGAALSLLFGVLALTSSPTSTRPGWRWRSSARASRPSSASASAAHPIDGTAARSDPASVRPAGGRPAALPPRSAGLPGAAAVRRDQLVPVPHRAGLVAARRSASRPSPRMRIGYPVIRHPLPGGAVRRRLAGLGGAYLSVVYTPLWVEGMTAGKGWIALALVVFATWRPLRVLLGAYLFGGVTILQLQGQALGLAMPSELLSALPYLATIVVLVIISRNRQMLAQHFPASLAKPFRPAN